MYSLSSKAEKELPVSKIVSLEPVSIEAYDKLKDLIWKIYGQSYTHIWSDSGKNYLNETYSKEKLEMELSDKNAQYYFMKSEGEAVGILRFITNLNIHNKVDSNSIKLHRIYLDKKVQGKGIGTQIIRWLEKEYPTCNIWLEVMDTQSSVINFYERLDFEIVDKTQINSKYIVPRYKGMYLMVKR